jgi:queuine tRNA-ribosyltransferase
MTRAGRLNLRNATFAGDRRPIDPECACPTCARFGRGAIRHYLLAGEILGLLLLVTHNVSFVVDLVAQARAAILAGRFEEFLRAQRSRALEKTAALAGAEDEGTAKVAGSPVREAGRDRA